MAINPQRITAEQLRMLFAAQPLTLAGSILNACILVVVLWPILPHNRLLFWLGIFLLLSLLRGVVLYRYRRRRDGDDKRYQQYALHLTLMTGAWWGAICLLLFPYESVPHQSFIAFVLAGNSAAATISLSYIRSFAYAFVLPSLLPMIAQLFLLQTGMSTAMGTMVTLFLLVSMSGIRRNNQNIEQNISLRLASIEHEKAILDAQQRMALHVQQTPLGVIEWSTEFRVVNWNPAAEHIFGFSKPEVMGRKAYELIVPASAKQHVADVWDALLTQRGGLRSTNENITRDGRAIICEWYNTPLVNESNKVIGIASLVQDVTERTRMEKMQNDFISTVSHELRTPLTSIHGAISILNNGVLSNDSDDYKHILEIASNNAERLLLIINDILDIQKMDSGKMEFHFHELELQHFLHEAVEANQPYADKYQVRFRLLDSQDRLMVNADHNRLMQVMDNLLSNAAKFSRPGQTIDIQTKRVDDMAQILVQDQGEGIPNEFLSQVFDRFSQGDSSNTRRTGGTGLGMSIVKNIIELHNGQVSLESQVGRGTRVYVSLPLVKQEATSSKD